MTMKHWSRMVTGIAVCAAIGLAAGRAEAKGVRVKQDLALTGVDLDSTGRARIRIVGPGNDLVGSLDIIVRKLERDATFEVDLEGIRIGTLRTTGGGNGHVRFRTRPGRHDQLLGVDPRGKLLQVRNAAGNPVLEAGMPDDTIDPTKIRCCLPDDDDRGEQPECEDRTPAECAAAGGVNLGAGSCVPNPCEAAPPQADEDIVCCIPDDSGPECEDRSPAGCSAEGGINLGAGTCVPNPCAATVPTAPETIQCCLPDDSEVECEDRTPAMCAADGGTNMGPGTCSPNPCPQLPPAAEQTRCCLPDNSGVQCEDRTPSDCAAQGGTDIGPGVCDPTACPALPPPPQDTRCCVPKNDGPECEDRTPDECAARGGTDIGPGSCVPNPCM
jgi:hypothetical protein